MFLKLFADSWNSFFQSSFFFNPQAHRTLPIQEQAHRVNRQLESIKHRFNQLEEICEHGSIVSKELLSSVKNWNLLKEDAFSLILDPINIFQTKTTIDLSANLKKLNKITIQFAKLINCYQTSYGIYVLRNTTKYFPEYYSSILHQELNHLSEKVTKNEIKTQKKLVKEVVEKTFTNYVPIFISLCTGLSSKIAGKLCKFTLLSTKQWYTLEDTKKNQKHLQEFQSIIETAPEETDFLLNQFRSLLITKTKAAEAEGNAIKIAAEAERQAAQLRGQGVALFREEVAKGMSQAAEQMKQANLDTNVILFSMWTEAIKNFAEYGKGNVIFLDGSSEGMEKTMRQIMAMQQMEPRR